MYHLLTKAVKSKHVASLSLSLSLFPCHSGLGICKVAQGHHPPALDHDVCREAHSSLLCGLLLSVVDSLSLQHNLSSSD